MTLYRAGDIVLVRFPFTDLSSTKKRPALVLSTPRFTARHGDVVVLSPSGQPPAQPKLRLSRWRSSGLLAPTCIKLVIGTLAATLVLRRLGKLHPVDRPRVVYALRHLIHTDFLK